MDSYTLISLTLGLVQLNFAETKSFASDSNAECFCLALSVLLAGLMLFPAHRSKLCYHTAALCKEEVSGAALS